MCVSGKHVFKGYYNNPELTAKSKFTKNGKEYFKTGTIGFIDEDGYFTITSRQSRFYINSSLNKVYCDKVQNIICKLSVVKDCAVVKISDEDELFVNKAYIVLNDGIEELGEIVEYIKECCNNVIEDQFGNKFQLKDFEIPTYFEIVPELLIKSGTDKIDYNQLENVANEVEKIKVKSFK